jgi:hypothetical protein
MRKCAGKLDIVLTGVLVGLVHYVGELCLQKTLYISATDLYLPSKLFWFASWELLRCTCHYVCTV